MNKKKIVNITVRDKIAEGDGTEFVCDNTCYRLRFDFDEEWAGLDAKTARVKFGHGCRDFPFVGNEVDIDRIPVARSVTIGVYAGDLKATVPAFFKCKFSVLSDEPVHVPPPEDVYNEIMRLISLTDDAIYDTDELPTEGINAQAFYRVDGRLYYRVGDAWTELGTDFFDYVSQGEYDKAVASLSGSIKKLEEADTATGETLTAHGEDIAKNSELLTQHGEKIAKAEDDIIKTKNNAIEASRKVEQIYSVANNALSTANIALTDVRTEEARAESAEAELDGKINAVESLAKGANKSLTYSDYATMIATLNSASREGYKIGQNILIVTLNVPDLWISEVVNLPSVYTYTTDEAFTERLKADGSVQVGYFKLSALETQKVDLTEYARKGEVKAVDDKLDGYVKSTDYATSEKAGLVKVGGGISDEIYTDADGKMHLGNLDNYVTNKNTEHAVRNCDIDLAVKAGITDNQYELTSEEKTKACDFIGAVKPTDYATGTVGGTVKVSNGDTAAPLYRSNNGTLMLGNINALIDAKKSQNAIRNTDIDYAVMKALTEPVQHTWTPEQTAAARATLGAVGATDYAVNSTDGGGVVKIGNDLGIGQFSSGVSSWMLYIRQATEGIITGRKTHNRAIYSPITAGNLDFAVKESLTSPQTVEWTADEQALAQKTLGVGEWIEAEALDEDSYSIKFTEAGVYEYFAYVEDDRSDLSKCLSNILIFDKQRAGLLDAYISSDDIATLYVHLEGMGNQGYSSLQLHIKGNPYNVAFKMRKIREI